MKREGSTPHKAALNSSDDGMACTAFSGRVGIGMHSIHIILLLNHTDVCIFSKIHWSVIKFRKMPGLGRGSFKRYLCLMTS